MSPATLSEAVELYVDLNNPPAIDETPIASLLTGGALPAPERVGAEVQRMLDVASARGWTRAHLHVTPLFCSGLPKWLTVIQEIKEAKPLLVGWSSNPVRVGPWLRMSLEVSP